MEAIVSPSRVSGVYSPPASKSAMQRACAAALLHNGTTVLYNPGRSEDDAAALRIIGQLGAQVTDEGDRIEIASTGHPQLPQQPLIDCGESGLSIRMFTPIAALVDGTLQLTGRGSLLQRPMQFFAEVLPQLGVRTNLNKGLLPISINGPLQPADIEIDGSQSSQYLTGLLMAYGAAAHNGASIHVRDLKSKPYVDLTLALMQHFGMNVPRNEGYEAFVFGPSKPRAQSVVTYTVEGDWSGAAFGLVAGAIAGRLEVKGLDVFSEQADKNILQVLIQAGIPLSVREDGITVGSDSLPFGKGRGWAFNATDCPDLFPPLVALAAFCDGTSVIEGVSRLAHKESNRALTLQEEFGKLGLTVELQDDLMIIRGGGPIRGAVVSARHDHRIAMALAVAALRAEGPVTITGAEAVGKSYPQFWQHLQQLGAAVSLTGQSNA
ncbi:MAG: 3-phosphoshikimate 1-carboxyvinyltransferase [Chitinophagaceae bacterium]|nr:MAG: 3-phosphoshikimate 1-carboxyvinyltransferase [Chitinophagaceae bacterium]